MEFIDKSQIMQGIGPDTTADLLEKAMGHKYFKREGAPGNYKYYYTEEEYKQAKGSDTEPTDSKTLSVQEITSSCIGQLRVCSLKRNSYKDAI